MVKFKVRFFWVVRWEILLFKCQLPFEKPRVSKGFSDKNCRMFEHAVTLVPVVTARHDANEENGFSWGVFSFRTFL